MTKRTDIHRPSAIIPADYALRICYILPGEDPFERWNTVEAVALASAARAAGKAVFGGMGRCGVCGANFRYGDIWEHVPTGDLVHFGHDCADKYELLADRADFNAEKACMIAARLARETAARNKAAREALLAANPGLAEALECDHYIVNDIKAKFGAYSDLSPKQIALVLKIAKEAAERADARATEKHVAAPTGRVVVRGVLVSKKSVENDFGSSLKGTVKVETPEGSWLAWGTLPASMLYPETDPCAERGDVVEFTATLKPGRDSYFALWSRPTKGRVVERAAKAEEASEVA